TTKLQSNSLVGGRAPWARPNHFPDVCPASCTSNSFMASDGAVVLFDNFRLALSPSEQLQRREKTDDEPACEYGQLPPQLREAGALQHAGAQPVDGRRQWKSPHEWLERCGETVCRK